MQFLMKEADILCNPITSNLDDVDEDKPSKLNRQSSPRFTLLNETAGTPKQSSCLYCKKKYHTLHKCRQFISKSPEVRRDFILVSHLCFSCLKEGHTSKECTDKSMCATCKGAHPTCLHGDFDYLKSKEESMNILNVSQSSETKPDSQPNYDDTSTSHRISNTVSHQQTSMVVPVYISSSEDHNNELLVYAMLDTQSDTTFLLSSAADKLNVKGESTKLRVSTMTTTTSIKCNKIKNLLVRGVNSKSSLSIPAAYTRDVIPTNREHIPTRETALQWPHLKEIQHKMSPLLECEVALLIGYNCPAALKPLSVLHCDDADTPYGVETALGWSIISYNQTLDFNNNDISVHRSFSIEVPDVVKVQGNQHKEHIPNRLHLVCRSSCKEIKYLLESDFLENNCEERTMSQEDVKFLSILKSETRINKAGFYEMPLPFKSDRPVLPNNEKSALKRLMCLRKKLKQNIELHSDYTEFMNMMLANNYAEQIPASEDTPVQEWYIPHHAVYNLKKTPNARIVFDCSATYNSTCLNDHLLQGPDLLNSLITVLCKFRERPVAIMADIEKMFYRFKVREDHRDYLRYFWWKDGDINSDPLKYRMTVHLFGATSSPGCANYALKRLAEDQRDEHSLDAVNFMLNHFYVDDGLISLDSPKEAISLINEARELCLKGNLRLHKFASNNRDVLDSIPECELAKGMKDVNLLTCSLPIERALGIRWCTETDTLRFMLTIPHVTEPFTRRRILSIISSLYDPLGCIAPFQLLGKQILQLMCKDDVDWDSPISENLLPKWERWIHELALLDQLKVVRCYVSRHFGKTIRRELHYFSDASTSGYGQCTYLRQIDVLGNVHCALVIAKARVVPLKSITIPRLELTAAVLSVKISKLLSAAFSGTIDAEYYWTDSQIVLGYIYNESKRFHVYVANRIQQIRSHTESTQWRYVNSQNNPADMASRGAHIQEIIASEWYDGPSFLWQKELPDDITIEHTIPDDDPEVKMHVFRTETTFVSQQPLLLEIIDRFSNWNRAVTVITLCRVYVCKLRTKVQAKLGTITTNTSAKKSLLYTTTDVRNATSNIFSAIQAFHFAEEISIMSKNKYMPNNNRFSSLDPFIDDAGILRVGGRLKQSALSYEVKHPILLPRDSHATRLIIRHFHDATSHQGRGITTNAIRSHGIWIIACSKVVASVIFKCVTCRRLRGYCQTQKMADLPDKRLEPSPPFTHCAIDCFGPFTVKERRTYVKRYGLMVTCMASRAVHVEVLDDMTADAFINSLRCVTAIRGQISTIRCDQGTNFKGAARELRSEDKIDVSDKAVQQYLINKNCRFLFNTPCSSHMGGLVERHIRTIRSILQTIFHHNHATLDTSMLRTFFYEAMAIINSRPLTVQNLHDPTSPIPLSPNHLLTMKSDMVMPPPGNFTEDDLYLRKRWRKVQCITNLFWKRWQSEYVHMLQQRQKWKKPKRNVTQGDIVMLTDDDMPRNSWKLGRVLQVLPTKSEQVRRVKVLIGDCKLSGTGRRTGTQTVLERPIHKLVLLVENASNC